MKKSIKMIPMLIIVLLIFALAFIAGEGYEYGQSNGEIIGKDTFLQTMIQADGSEVNFYASGDEYFNYCHDENGYILLRDKGYLVYAKNEKGRPIPSQVRYSDSKEKINSLDKMIFSEINFSENRDLITDYGIQDVGDLYQSADPSRPIVNFVIYIKFAGEDLNLDEQRCNSYLNGPENSLKDYYQDISYGEIVVNNIIPETNEFIFVYEDNNPRSYYHLTENASTYIRRAKESQLLNKAINASKAYFEINDLNIDIDNDGYIDAVNFLLSGSPYSEWGGMLWPHSWDLNEISGGVGATINGLKVRKYSFNFLDQMTVGLLCHEFSHVLGSPDLYHYNDNTGHIAVGNWDLMHYEGDTPQYMTTHLREKYLNVISDEQIELVQYNGVYSLKPVTTTGPNEILAYKIYGERSDEYFMVEYRNNNVTTYDSSLPGSGLIVYRVKENVYGNQEAQYHSTSNPDEVYVFRPNVVTTGTEATKSLANLNKAYLSPSNPDFSSLGTTNVNSTYSSSNIYYTNGINSGIVINTIEISDEHISFSISLSNQDNVEDDYFEDKINVENVAFKNDVNFSGVQADIQFVSEIALEKLNNIIGYLKDENKNIVASINLNKNEFAGSYNNGKRIFPIRFVINNKGNNEITEEFGDANWKNYEKPTSLDIYIVDSDNDIIFLNDFPIDDSQVSWNSIEMTNIVYKPGISASLRSTIAVRSDGRAFVSSADAPLDGKIFEDVISAVCGDYHIICIKSNLSVVAFGSYQQGENEVGQWTNIIKVAGGEFTSYGLDLFGNVFSAGDNSQDVSEWNNIIDISAGSNHVVALKKDGTVVAKGRNSSGQCEVSEWSDIVAVSAGSEFTVGLKNNGSVVVAGQIDYKNNISNLSNIKKISAGVTHLLALTNDNRVIAIGDNNYGQCEVSSYCDIIDIAAGSYQSVMLREDGILLYAGNNTNNTNNIDENLLYYKNNYIEVQSLSVPFNEMRIKVGSDFDLDIKIFPLNATYKELNYVSNAPNIVSVDSNGKIHAFDTGTVTITVSHRGSDIELKIQIFSIQPIVSSPMIAAGENHSVLLDKTGTVFASGNNEYGQCDVEMWGQIKFIAAGGNTTVGIANDNTIKVAGELAGIGAESWENIISVSVSENAIIGIKKIGEEVSTVIGTGNNTYAQILGTSSSLWENIVQVSNSSSHTLALKNDGTVLAVGYNNNGQVSEVDGKWANVVKIIAKNGYSLGLKKDGTICYAGNCAGIEDMSNLLQWNNIIDIASSDNHIVGADKNGDLLALGNNDFQQCNVSDINSIRQIAVGNEHTVCLSEKGNVVGAGKNSDYRLIMPSVGALDFIGLQDVKCDDIMGIRIGENKNINLTFLPYNSTETKNENITYSSYQPYIASVDANGYVYGINNGTTTITIDINRSDNSKITTAIEVVVYAETAVQSIGFVSFPIKKVYRKNEILDLQGGRIEVTLNGGKIFKKNLTQDMIENFDTATSSLSSSKQIKISVGDQEISYDISIIDTITKIEFEDISIIKKDYFYGDIIDLSAGKIIITYSSNNPDTISLQDLYDNYQNQLVGEKIEIIADTEVLATTSVIIKFYDGYAISKGIDNVLYLVYDINVIDKVINISADIPYRYRYGEEIYGKGNLHLEMKSGAEIIEPIENINDKDISISIYNYNKYVMGEQKINIFYMNENFDCNQTITQDILIEDQISNVEITSMVLGTEEDEKLVYEITNPDNVSYDLQNGIFAKLTFAGGVECEVGSIEGSQISEYCQIEFGALSSYGGYQQTTIKIKIRNKVNDENSFMVADVIDWGESNQKAINLLGLLNVISVDFVSENESNEYPYGGETDLRLKICTENEPNGYDIDIDDTRLGIDNTKMEPQTIFFTVMGKTASTSIVFVDYVVEIYSEDTTIQALVGKPLNEFLDVYKVMASGTRELLEGNEWVVSQNYNNAELGLQENIKIKLSKNVSIFISINIEVIDGISEIEVIYNPVFVCQVNEDLDLTDFEIKITYFSGDISNIFYNEEAFSLENFNKNIIGNQIITIIYNLTGNSWEYNVEVRNQLSRIQVDIKKSKTTYMLGEELDVTLIGIYVNGDRSTIEDSFSNNFKNNILGEQDVNISYWSAYSTIFHVKVIDAPVQITITEPSRIHYQYGELLDLSGGKVNTITQNNDSYSIPLSDYREKLSQYNPTPTATGKQVITLSLPEYNLSASFVVYVKTKSKSEMVSIKDEINGVAIDNTNLRIVFDESTTFANFSNKVESYADIHFKDNENHYIDCLSCQNEYLSSKIKIEIKNREGTLLETYKIYIKGDKNCDGIFDENDLSLFANALANESNSSESVIICGDINNDKKFSLTDLALWVAKLEELEG